MDWGALPGAVPFILAAAASAALTWSWILLAKSRHLLDAPGARRLHSVSTPRGGGVGIALLGTAFLLVLGREHVQAWWLGAGVGLFALVGLADDLRPLPAAAKFAPQLLAASVLAWGFAAGMPAWQLALWILACAYCVNIVNFMDGSNGLVAAQGLVVGLALAAWPGQAPWIALAALVLAGSCAGFLPFNVPRARVFLGDVGSHAVGALMFAVLAASWHSGHLSLPQALLFGTPMLLDTGWTLARRTLAGRPIWRAHREHLYQYAVRSGLSHASVCMIYLAWTLSCVAMSTLSFFVRSSLVMWTILIFNWALGTAAYFGLRKRWLEARRQEVA